ncbi:TonB-dependent receptor [uncultured Parabacteroides sp.]|uniref:TonB-dependent receptor plug domain-containing protein n=1 Tax=uncultured Parabacteroides sp. TaxID=512312 RepID=UPI00258817B2|nr:TonB-dependent receptor [uncultured Parabacteroides sp.]
MKTILLFIATIFLMLPSLSAQQVTMREDSTFVTSSSFFLDEVTVTAKSVINKGDKLSILPSEIQRKTATDGVELLNKMQLSRIMVDVMSGEITTPGNGEVQLRINGILVTYPEVAALNPEDIIRIEYHDSPGVRYGNAAVVIDYITRKKESGGSIRGGAFHSIGGDRTSIDDMLSANYNNGKSEFSANVRFIQRKGDWTREYDEKLLFPDHELQRKEIGEPTLFNKKVLYSNLNYSLQEKDKYIFNAQFRYSYNDFPAGYEDRKSKLYSSGSDIPLSIYDHTVEKNHIPALDLYFQRTLKNNQSLIFNLVGTYIETKNNRIYQEIRENIPETDILSNISGKKYSLIAEGIYEKRIGKSQITGGVKHIQSYTDNQYTGTTTTDVTMNQNESFLYGEYQLKTGKWSYMANLTLSRFYYSQQNNKNEKYALQPSLRVTYNPNQDFAFRYNAALKNNTPSIGYLNDVEQPIDLLQVRRGNPGLKSFQSINQSFNAGYNKSFFGIDALVTYDYEHKPIMESILYEDGKFIRTYDNQQSFQDLAFEVAFHIKPWKDHINLSVIPGLNRYISHGNNYLHTYTMKSLRVNLDFSYRHWIANFATIVPPNRYVYGEQLMKGDLMHTLMVGYKMPAWSVMAGLYNPFIRTYRSENENWSALNPVKSDIHSNNMARTVVVKFNFNLNFGKQLKSIRKAVQNMDNDPGIISGNKD